jgi:hypothetical protein
MVTISVHLQFIVEDWLRGRMRLLIISEVV